MNLDWIDAKLWAPDEPDGVLTHRALVAVIEDSEFELFWGLQAKSKKSANPGTSIFVWDFFTMVSFRANFELKFKTNSSHLRSSHGDRSIDGCTMAEKSHQFLFAESSASRGPVFSPNILPGLWWRIRLTCGHRVKNMSFPESVSCSWFGQELQSRDVCRGDGG